MNRLERRAVRPWFLVIFGLGTYVSYWTRNAPLIDGNYFSATLSNNASTSAFNNKYIASGPARARLEVAVGGRRRLERPFLASFMYLSVDYGPKQAVIIRGAERRHSETSNVPAWQERVTAKILAQLGT
ncbi:hypothetical protein PRIPAC_88308 [Pristionchus pacificus]|uniref:Uncharacterized protein n=1 Tax=Pristionchus pacificus TaxID=54126 RepID=A0A2A6B9T2_PRIPA|nr:hypothetical protein PRIPAC_88308 [Pristionchus pacificus]|eukprot:PDM62636.1 hypothetical protein PRIPAC_52078 [Pristionchus pacificus]